MFFSLPCPGGGFLVRPDAARLRALLLQLGEKTPEALHYQEQSKALADRNLGTDPVLLSYACFLVVPALGQYQHREHQRFQSYDAPLYLYSAEIQPLRGFSFEFETGDNRFSGGKYYEHDWLHATNKTLYLLNGVTWDSPQHRDYAKKTAETSGTARQYSAAAYLNIYKTDGLAQDEIYELAHSLDFFAGYSWHETKIRLFNGYKIMSTDFFLPTAPVGPMTGLDSRATMRWHGLRLGFREQANLGKNFFAEGKFAFGPYMKYKGTNYWNLDTTLQNPGIRSSATGNLVEFSLSASYKFWRQFKLEGGWVAWSYKAASGKQTYYYTNSSTWEGKLNKVKATRKGVFFGLSWKY